MNAQIFRIEVESTATSHLSSTDRVLDLPFPILLNSATDTVSLRQKISAAQRPIGQKPGIRGGNGNRRIRIDIDAGKYGIIDFLSRLSLQQELPTQRASDLEVRELEEDEIEEGYRSRLLEGSRESLQLIRARRGQGIFRRNVLEVEPRCRITGVADQRFLRASHIKPWRLSTDEEKLDGNNGLMLSPHADALFDQGMISFRSDGRLIVSRQLDDLVLQLWRISTSLNVGEFTEPQSKYLRFHQENILM